MIVIFAGPSLHGCGVQLAGRFELRGPAACGDVLAAVQDGATTIGLIDGVFESSLSVWHKEILFALVSGVRVLGASSMGALRAAECAPFGMEGVGSIFEQYRSGVRTRDPDVAVLHAPAELGYRPITVALVDAEATALDLFQRGLASAGEAAALRDAADALHFKDRSWRSIMSRVGLPESRCSALLEAIGLHGHSQKTADAIELLQAVDGGRTGTARPVLPMSDFNATALFKRLRKRVMRGTEGARA